MTSDLVDVLKALVIVGIPAAIGLGWKALVNARRRETKLDQVIAIFEGRPADLLTNAPAEPGLLHQIDQIRDQLHRNGGTTLRDAVSRVELQVDEIRVAQLQEARQSAADRHRARTIEGLLRQHMLDGKDLLDVGQRNDDTMVAALRAAGIDVPDLEPLPRVVLDVPGPVSDDDP